MDLKIVKFIQLGENSFLDTLFGIITKFGEEIFFVCMFLILYWCVSHTYAFKFALFYLTSVLINKGIKLLVKRPRPWAASKEVINKLPANETSFPSGHSQGISCISTFIVYDCFKTKKFSKAINILILIVAILITLLVGYSRIYLGQHYLTDVLAGFIIGAGIMVLLQFLAHKFGSKLNGKINCEKILIVLSAIFVIALLIISFVDLGLSNSASAKIFRYAGMLFGTTLGYILSNRTINKTSEGLVAKCVKVIIGLLVVFGIFALFMLIPQNKFIVGVATLVCAFVATYVYPLVFNLVYKKIKKD